MSKLLTTELFPHQVDAVKFAIKHRYSMNGFQMGCLSGDTKIKVNSGGCSRVYRLEDLYFRRLNNKFTNDLKLRSYSKETDTISLNKIEEVVYSGVKEVFNVNLTYREFQLKATKDHKFLTERGWVKLSDLVENDRVMVDTTTRYQKKKVLAYVPKPRYNLRRVGAFHPYGQIVNSPVLEYRVLIHRLVKEAELNNLSLEDFISSTFSPNSLKYLDSSIYAVHHIDSNHKNNDPANLKILTHKEHQKLHGNSNHFGHGKPKFYKIRNIVSKGLEHTYDICCKAPNHNFVANGVVVHNSGKTLIAIYLALKFDYKTVVISPAYLKYNWKREFEKFSVEQLDLTILEMKQLKTLTELPSKINFINYEMVKKASHLFKDVDFIVFDEFHYLGNPQAQRTEASYYLIHNTRPDRVLLLSGSPIRGKVPQWFIPMAICGLDPQETSGKDICKLYDNHWKFKNRFCNKIEQKFGVRTITTFEGLRNRDELVSYLDNKYLRKSPNFEYKLPPITHKDVFVNLTKLDKELLEAYNEFEETGMSEHIMSVKATAALHKTPFTFQYAMNIIEEMGGPIVIYSDHIAPLFKLAELAEKKKISHTVIMGSTPSKKRDDYVQMFQDKKTQIFLATIGAASTGITITASSQFISNDKSWTHTSNEQSYARIHRIGQTNPCVIHNILSGKTDKLIQKNVSPSPLYERTHNSIKKNTWGNR